MGETLYRKCERCDGTGKKTHWQKHHLHSSDPFTFCGDCQGRGFVPVAVADGVEALLARAFDQGWRVELSRHEDGTIFASLVPRGWLRPIADGEGANVSDALRDVLDAAEGANGG